LRLSAERIQPQAFSIDCETFADFVREFATPIPEQGGRQQPRHVVLFGGCEEAVERRQRRWSRHRCWGNRIPAETRKRVQYLQVLQLSGR
jgi:hypothetical protein